MYIHFIICNTFNIIFKPDKFILRFFNDRNNNYVKDSIASEVVLNYQIPRKN